MTTAVSINGQLVAPENATISVFDRGFLYGDSVFETVRTYSGKAYALRTHIQRLERSAELVFIEPAVSGDVLEDEVAVALAAAANPESYIRITVTRGQGELGLHPTLARGSTRVIIVSELKVLAPELYATGIKVASFRSDRPNDLAGTAQAKVGNYLVAVLAMRAASVVGAQEALIMGQDGRVVEGATSNVFWVRNGELYTPPVSAGILPGITRQGVLRAAERLGIPVHFECPLIEELKAADEVFISSSIRELMPVVNVDGGVVGAGHVGECTRRLHGAFREDVARSFVTDEIS